MEFDNNDFEKSFGDAKTYAISKTEKQAVAEYTYTYDDNKTAVLCHNKDKKDDGEKESRGSCLICLAYKEHNIKEHANYCKKLLISPTNCPICMSECTDAHLYSHSHAATLEKFRLIEKNGGKVGLAKAGALVIDLAGDNIVRTELVHDLKNRLHLTKKTSPGGLASYYLKTSLAAAVSNKSDAKKLSENSAIVQTLLQVCLTCSAGHIPCVAAAKIAYTLNGYSIVELIGALAQEYPKFYAYQFTDKECVLHKKKERTIVFTDSLTSYNHTVTLLRTLTGRDIKAMAPFVKETEPAKSENNMDIGDAQPVAPQTASAGQQSRRTGAKN